MRRRGPSTASRYVPMGKLSESNNLRYRPLFAILMVVAVVALSRVAKVSVERTLLPQLHPSTQPLRVTNNNGTLSNGERLQGWRNAAYFVTYGVSWMIGCAVVAVALARLWPEKPAATQTPPLERTGRER